MDGHGSHGQAQASSLKNPSKGNQAERDHHAQPCHRVLVAAFAVCAMLYLLMHCCRVLQMALPFQLLDACWRL